MASKVDTYSKIFVGTWIATSAILFGTNFSSSSWREERISYVRMNDSVGKAYLLGFPLLFFPNMVIRSSQSLLYKDSLYLVPPFFYEASEHPVYKKYANNL